MLVMSWLLLVCDSVQPVEAHINARTCLTTLASAKWRHVDPREPSQLMLTASKL